MEMLIKDGIVKNSDNKKIIQFINTNSEVDKEFKKSFYNVVDYIDGYDIKKSSINTNKDVYYLYDFNTDVNELELTMKKLSLGNFIDILNIDESKIMLSLYNNNEENIFWDVLNNVIIIIGKDNLKFLLSELEKKRWEFIKFNSEELKKQYIDLCASNVYRKVMTKS